MNNTSLAVSKLPLEIRTITDTTPFCASPEYNKSYKNNHQRISPLMVVFIYYLIRSLH